MFCVSSWVALKPFLGLSIRWYLAMIVFLYIGLCLDLLEWRQGGVLAALRFLAKWNENLSL